MIARQPAVKKYVVILSAEERQQVSALIQTPNTRGLSLDSWKCCEEGKACFFEKSSKKLLSRLSRLFRQRTPGIKSFLVLFSKKELLALPS